MLIKTEPIPLRTVATWVSQGPQHHPGPFLDLPVIQRLKGTAGGLQAPAPAPISICSDELVTVPTVKCHPWQRTLLWWDLGRLVSVGELSLVLLTWRVFTRQSWARPHLHGAPSPGWKPLKDQTHLAAQHRPQGKGRGAGGRLGTGGGEQSRLLRLPHHPAHTWKEPPLWGNWTVAEGTLEWWPNCYSTISEACTGSLLLLISNFNSVVIFRKKET